MRLYSRFIMLLLPLPCFLTAQQWEVGASGGYGIPRNVDVTGRTLSGEAGFERGWAAGALLGNQMNKWVGGEARYTFQKQDLRVSSGSVKATRSGQSHAIHYDVLVHALKREATVRPFVAAGAGVKWFRGRGEERRFQELSNLVVLTRTNEAQALVSVGGGVKVALSRHSLIRFDFRDYLTPIPTNLLATPPGSRLHGWLNDFVFLVGISAAF
jgi:hypothetical protein